MIYRSNTNILLVLYICDIWWDVQSNLKWCIYGSIDVILLCDMWVMNTFDDL